MFLICLFGGAPSFTFPHLSISNDQALNHYSQIGETLLKHYEKTAKYFQEAQLIRTQNI